MHEISGKVITSVIKTALELEATDNLTIVIIAFKPFSNLLQKKDVASTR